MGFEAARPEYYQGLKVFQTRTNQQEQLRRLAVGFFQQWRMELAQLLPSDPLAAHLQSPLRWLDLGSGDGSMAAKLLAAFCEAGFAAPRYEGMEPDPVFVTAARAELAAHPRAIIRQGEAFDGSLHQSGKRDLVTGVNSLYFVNDYSIFVDDLNRTLALNGLGIFAQNRQFTDKARHELERIGGKTFTASVATEVFFPALSGQAWQLLTHRASEADLLNGGLTAVEAEQAVVTKRIIDAMGGISTETAEGQQKARQYRDRILGNDYGGPGRYVTDNCLLVYLPPGTLVCFQRMVAAVIKAVHAGVE